MQDLLKKWWFWVAVIVILFLIFVPVINCSEGIIIGGSTPRVSVVSYLINGCG